MKCTEIVIKASNMFYRAKTGVSRVFLKILQEKTEKVALFICEKQKKLGYNSLPQNTEKPLKVKTIFKNCY